MPTLSDTQLAALRAELQAPAYTGLSDARRFDLLNSPSAVANPAAQGSVPKPFTVTDLMGLLDVVALGKIYGRPATPAFRNDVEKQDRAAVANWIGLAAAAGDVSAAQQAAMNAVLTATEPDPSWPATVAGPSPKERLFPGASWSLPDGSAVNYIPLDDVGAAR